MKKEILRAATAVVISGGVGLTGLGVGIGIGTAGAEPAPVPMYHWCPGDFWDPLWGFNWEGSVCHDDWHRDMDGDRHDRDWHTDRDDRHDDRDRDHYYDHDGPWWPN
jgi:hypothetical protein